MITQGADVLIIAAIDGTALSSQLQAAADAEHPGHRLRPADPRHARTSTSTSRFDNFAVGVAQANALLTGLGIAERRRLRRHGHRTVQHRAVRRLAGRQQRLLLLRRRDVGPAAADRRRHARRQVGSDRHRAGRHAALAAGDRAEAHGGPAHRASYNDGSIVNGVLSPYDGLSRGIITALQNAGYGPTIDAGAKPMPIVTGQDAEIASVKLIADGVQSSTIFKDTRLLAEQAVVAAQAFLEGDEPEANDTETYDNGVKVVPSYLLPVETVFADDIQSVLVDSGYWTAEEVAVRPGRLTARPEPGRARRRRPLPGPAGTTPRAPRTAPGTAPLRTARTTLARTARPHRRRGRRNPWPTTSWRCAPSPRPSPASRRWRT